MNALFFRLFLHSSVSQYCCCCCRPLKHYFLPVFLFSLSLSLSLTIELVKNLSRRRSTVLDCDSYHFLSHAHSWFVLFKCFVAFRQYPFSNVFKSSCPKRHDFIIFCCKIKKLLQCLGLFHIFHSLINIVGQHIHNSINILSVLCRSSCQNLYLSLFDLFVINILFTCNITVNSRQN